jgi:hypothetical protein
MSKTPSIAVIPSGYKASKVYSVLPTNGDADLDFTRNCVATRVNQNGLLEEVGLNVPRLDYSDGGCPSLLLEPESTNLIEYSEDLSIGWSEPTRATISSETITNPNGVSGAYSIFPNTDTSTHFISEGLSSFTNQNYSVSAYVKNNGSDYCLLRLRNSASANKGVYVNLVNGTLGYVESGVTNEKIVDVGNGWYRVSFTLDYGGTGNSIFFGYPSNGENSGDENYLGVVTEGFFLWGVQIEALPYATSYIPTNGTTVTRFKDQASKDNLESYINSSEGVLYAEINVGNVSDVSRYLSISDGSTSNRVILGVSSSSNKITSFLSGGGSSISIFSSTIDLTENHKVAVKWKQNEFKLFVNGVLESSNTANQPLPINISNLGFNDGRTAKSELFGKTKDLRVYNEALTDAELIELTQ